MKLYGHRLTSSIAAALGLAMVIALTALAAPSHASDPLRGGASSTAAVSLNGHLPGTIPGSNATHGDNPGTPYGDDCTSATTPEQCWQTVTWYSWTPTETSSYALSTSSTGLNTTIEVWQDGILLANNNDDGDSVLSRTFVRLEAETTYLIGVGTPDRTISSFYFTVEQEHEPEPEPEPVDVDLAGGATRGEAAHIGDRLPGSFVGSNRNITSTTGTGDAECTSGIDPKQCWWNTGWYSWTPASDQTIDIELLDHTFDTGLEIWHGDTLITNDDDGGQGSASRVLFFARSGVTYLIGVGSYYQDETGTFTVSGLDTGAASGGPDRDSAVELGSDIGTQPFAVTATSEAGEPGGPECSSDTTPKQCWQNSAWFSWTPSHTGTTRVTIGENDFGASLEVWRGDTLIDIAYYESILADRLPAAASGKRTDASKRKSRTSQAWASRDVGASGGDSTLLINHEAGSTYLIGLGSAGGKHGIATLSASTTPAAPASVSATAADQSVTVSWPAPTGSAPVTGYAVLAYVGGTQVSQTNVTGRSATITGLTNGTAYTFRVRAYNDFGLSPLSPMSAAVTPVAPAAAAPGGPGIPAATQTVAKGCVITPGKLVRNKTIRVMKPKCKTNTGTLIRASITKIGGKGPLPQIKRTEAGTVVVTKKAKAQVRISWIASATSTHQQFVKTKTYTIK